MSSMTHEEKKHRGKLVYWKRKVNRLLLVGLPVFTKTAHNCTFECKNDFGEVWTKTSPQKSF